MKGESRTQKKFDKLKKSAVISKNELYNHFDLKGKGKVTKQDYDDHIDWHCNHSNMSPGSNKNCNCKQFNPFFSPGPVHEIALDEFDKLPFLIAGLQKLEELKNMKEEDFNRILKRDINDKFTKRLVVVNIMIDYLAKYEEEIRPRILREKIYGTTLMQFLRSIKDSLETGPEVRTMSAEAAAKKLRNPYQFRHPNWEQMINDPGSKVEIN